MYHKFDLVIYPRENLSTLAGAVWFSQVGDFSYYTVASTDIDFKYLHENKANKLFDIWPEVSTKLISVAKKRAKDSDVLEFLKKYDETMKEGNNEVIQIISILLLPTLLKTASFKSKTCGKHWRPSLNEVQREFILHALS
ncbi:uncharacterized protein LOC117175552 [Belonocnema kinseyi]|uniref:uncharacterized protein LOC117175552 n=1 Tax=Belonocnema kinseyi TaxID=2817044 RepID=UPI00143CD9E0|nr:uncharacterized protein LOC117175552 [Belonocnema kinseyi]